MFCNACGTEIQPQFNACPNCGRLVTAPALSSQPSRLERHLRIVGILWIIAGALFLIPAITLMMIGSVIHIAVPGTEVLGRLVGPLILFILGGTLFVLAAGGILVGRGLLKLESWARTVALVLAILALFHPPFGTALGIYTLWVLLSNNAGSEYARLARAT
jgi:hypothetical protein